MLRRLLHPLSINKQARWRWALLALLLLPVAEMAWLLFGPRGVMVEVQAKTWLFEIEVETQVLETASGWCDELPEGARDITRRLIADPSGTRPGLSEHCRYSVPQWHKAWVPQVQGRDPAPPRWPVPSLKPLPADEIGGERLGKHNARYLLQLRGDDDEHWTCQLPLPQWQRFREGERFRLLIDRYRVADCASVPVR